jgi:hypothetical protein
VQRHIPDRPFAAPRGRRHPSNRRVSPVEQIVTALTGRPIPSGVELLFVLDAKCGGFTRGTGLPQGSTVRELLERVAADTVTTPRIRFLMRPPLEGGTLGWMEA